MNKHFIILLSLIILFIIPKVSYSAMTMKDEQQPNCSFCKKQLNKNQRNTLHSVYAHLCPACRKMFAPNEILKGNTRLHLAVANGSLDAVKALLAGSANPNARNNQGNTPLHLANGNIAIIKELLAGGANPTIKNNLGEKPLGITAVNGANDINTKHCPKNRNGNTPLHVAAENGDLELVKQLVTKGADINAKNNNGFLPMQLAIQKDQTAVVEVLLAAQFTYISTLSAPDRKDILTLAARLQPLAK